MDWTLLREIIDIISGAKGTIALLVLLLVGNFLEVWVWGHVFRRRMATLEHERDRWMQLALSTTSLAKKALIFNRTEED
jgi:hypothetical protein